MALRNVAKMLSRHFSRGPGSSIGGGIESKNIRHEKLRTIALRYEQAIKETNQLADDCKAMFALKRAFPIDRLLWILLAIDLGALSAKKGLSIHRIKEWDSQLSARRAKAQELQSLGKSA